LPPTHSITLLALHLGHGTGGLSVCQVVRQDEHNQAHLIGTTTFRGHSSPVELAGVEPA